MLTLLHDGEVLAVKLLAGALLLALAISCALLVKTERALAKADAHIRAADDSLRTACGLPPYNAP